MGIGLAEENGYVCEFLNVFWPGCAEHECLTIWANLANDLSDLGFETHIKHTVSFVHDEVSYAAKVCLLGLQHVDQTAWGSDSDLDASLEVTNLRALWGATIDGSVADSRV